MPSVVDYYIAPQSPYVYLGNERFRGIVRKTHATVRLLPIDLGRIFPASGGLPLNQRAPQRLAYRLLELKRFSRWNGLPLNVQPAFFPVNGDDAARLLIAVDREDGTEAALRLLGAMGAAVWADERNLADASTLEHLLAKERLPLERLEQARSPTCSAGLRRQHRCRAGRRRLRCAQLRGRRRAVLGTGPARLRGAPPGRRLKGQRRGAKSPPQCRRPVQAPALASSATALISSGR